MSRRDGRDSKPRGLRLRVAQLRTLRARFGALMAAERGWLIAAGAALVVETLFQVLAPFPVKYLVDGLLTPGAEIPLPGVPAGYPAAHPHRFLGIVCGAMVAFALAGGAAGYLRVIWSATAGQRMVAKLRKRLYAHLQTLSLAFHRKQGLGDLLMRLTGDIAMLRDVLSVSLIELVGHVAVVVAMVAILFVLDVTLATIAFSVMALVIVFTILCGARIAKLGRKQRESEGILANTAGEALAAIPLVKAFGCEEWTLEAFGRRNRASTRKSLKGTRLQAALERRVELLFAAGVAAVFAAGVLRVSEAFTVGDLLVFVAFIHRLNKPLRKIAGMASRIGKASACGERIVEIFGIAPEESDTPDATPAPVLRGEVRFENITFAHEPGGPAVLDGLDLEIHAGERVALVGRNGAGKSTLIHLLLRFHEPIHGRVLIDGHDIRAFTIRSLRAQISIALQNTLLFGATVRENLLCAAPAATDADMERALMLAGAADLVERLPEGLDTRLADQGGNLSGGERRRIALAAAVLRPAPILLLDEPTTHIDRASQDEILDRLPLIAEGRTCIVVTHDPHALAHVDRVIYLEHGRVAADGSHQELMLRSAAYRALFPEERQREAVVAP